jgi:hypothetical protein
MIASMTCTFLYKVMPAHAIKCLYPCAGIAGNDVNYQP